MINVPSKTDKQLLKDFIDLYTDVEGLPCYPKKKYSKIKHQTGTRIDNVTNNMNNIPCFNSLLGCRVKLIYINQPKLSNNNNNVQSHNRDDQNTLTTTRMYKTTTY